MEIRRQTAGAKLALVQTSRFRSSNYIEESPSNSGGNLDSVRSNVREGKKTNSELRTVGNFLSCFQATKARAEHLIRSLPKQRQTDGDIRERRKAIRQLGKIYPSVSGNAADDPLVARASGFELDESQLEYYKKLMNEHLVGRRAELFDRVCCRSLISAFLMFSLVYWSGGIF